MILVGNALKPGFPGLPWTVLVVRMEGKCKCKWAAVSLRRRLNWRIFLNGSLLVAECDERFRSAATLLQLNAS